MEEYLPINKKELKKQSIHYQIKRKIGRRVFCCLLLLFITLTLITIFDAIRAFNSLSISMMRLGEQEAQFIISQAVVDNEQSIPLQLKEASQTNHVEIEWITNSPVLNADKMHWTPLFSWEYSMPIVWIDGRHFGNLKIHGSLIKNSPLIYEFFVRTFFLFLTLSIVFFLLAPLIKSIPEKMFIQPLLGLLALLENNSKIPEKYIQTFGPSRELYQLTQKILALLETIRSTSKKIAFSQITAQLAHDINNYLVGLHACIQNISEIPDAQREKIHNYLKDIDSMTNKVLSKYGKDIETSLGTESSDRTTLSIISQILKSTNIATIQSSAKGIKLVTNIDRKLYDAFVFVDGIEFRRLLINLMNNAIEALPKSNSITITVMQELDSVVIKIIDDGKGIPNVILEKLGREEVTHGKTNGHGLGVFHAHNMIKKWGGKFFIDSKEGIGTTITIKLPIANQPKSFVPVLDLSNIKGVVIIDDDKNIHNQWRKKLGSYPIEIQDFFSPEEAIDFLKKRPVDTDTLFLIDYQYSGKSMVGLDVVKKLSIFSQSILVTGRSDENAIIEECEKLGIRLLAKDMIDFLPVSIKS